MSTLAKFPLVMAVVVAGLGITGVAASTARQATSLAPQPVVAPFVLRDTGSGMMVRSGDGAGPPAVIAERGEGSRLDDILDAISCLLGRDCF